MIETRGHNEGIIMLQWDIVKGLLRYDRDKGT